MLMADACVCLRPLRRMRRALLFFIDEMVNGAVGKLQEVAALFGVDEEVFGVAEGDPMEVDGKITAFQFLLCGKDAAAGRVRIDDLDIVIEADLVAGLIAPREKDLGDPAQTADADLGADLFFELTDKGLGVGLAELHVAAGKGVAGIVRGLLQKDAAVLDADAGDAVTEDVVIGFEKYIGHGAPPETESKMCSDYSIQGGKSQDKARLKNVKEQMFDKSARIYYHGNRGHNSVGSHPARCRLRVPTDFGIRREKMKTHEIVLRGYEAECDGVLLLGTEDSFGTERLHVILQEDWEDLTVTAVFTNGSSTEVMMDADGMIAVPPEAVAESTGESFGRIVFKGVADGVQRISGDVLYMALPHGPITGENSLEPTPDQFSQFVDTVSAEADRAAAAAQRAEEAGSEADPALIRESVAAYLQENPVPAVALDATLTMPGEAAEAKAVGDAMERHDAADGAHPLLWEALAEQSAHLEEHRGQIEKLQEEKQPAGNYLTAETDPTVPAWAKSPTKPTYTCDEVGAAAAGFGYGEVTEYIVDENGTFEDKLNGILAGMQGFQCKQFSFYDTKGLISYKFLGRLWKYTSSYAVLEAVTYHNHKAMKRFYGGVWQPWEWENPPMQFGVEYRTTERHEGKPVYVCAVDLGVLPDSISKTVNLPVTPAKIVSLDGAFTDGTVTHRFPSVNYGDGYITGVLQIRAGKAVAVKTFTGMSQYTGYALVKYIKD